MPGVEKPSRTIQTGVQVYLSVLMPIFLARHEVSHQPASNGLITKGTYAGSRMHQILREQRLHGGSRRQKRLMRC